MSLAEKIRESRKIEVTVDGMIFFGRRPTEEEFGEIKDQSTYDVCKRFVTDWRNVKESDLIEGGSDELIPFDAELFAEYIVDRHEVSSELCKKFVTETINRVNNRAEKIKNLGAGSKASKQAR